MLDAFLYRMLSALSKLCRDPRSSLSKPIRPRRVGGAFLLRLRKRFRRASLDAKVSGRKSRSSLTRGASKKHSLISGVLRPPHSLRSITPADVEIVEALPLDISVVSEKAAPGSFNVDANDEIPMDQAISILEVSNGIDEKVASNVDMKKMDLSKVETREVEGEEIPIVGKLGVVGKSLTINISLAKLADIEDSTLDSRTPGRRAPSPTIARLRATSSPVSRRSCEHPSVIGRRPPNSPLPSLILHRRQYSPSDLVNHINSLSLHTFISLISIDLSRNRLTRLPSEFTHSTLPNLLHLNLSSNGLADFPDLSGFPNLRTLNLSQNSLTGSLPDPLPLQTPYLTSFNISANAITRLPPTIARWTSLETLILGSLIYGGNQLTALPEGTFSFLRALVELDVSHNLLTSLPSDLGHKDSHLRYLTAANNKIQHFPPSIPHSLRSLNLRHNQIASLPHSITELTELETIDLSENLLFILPAEVVLFLKSHTTVLTGNPFTRPGNCNLDGSKDVVKSLLRRGVVRKFKIFEESDEDSEDERMDWMVLQALGLEKYRSDTSLKVSGVTSSTARSSSDETTYAQESSLPPIAPKKARRRRPRSLITATREDSPVPSPCRLTPRLGALGMTIKDNSEEATPAATPITPSFRPKIFVPSLVELCARQLLKSTSISTLPIDVIPEPALCYLSSGPRHCAGCRDVYVREYIAGIQIKGTEYGGVLVRGKFCSSECWRKRNQDVVVAIKQALEREML